MPERDSMESVLMSSRCALCGCDMKADDAQSSTTHCRDCARQFYSPDQPRAPKGDPAGGQFASVDHANAHIDKELGGKGKRKKMKIGDLHGMTTSKLKSLHSAYAYAHEHAAGVDKMSYGATKQAIESVLSTR